MVGQEMRGLSPAAVTCNPQYRDTSVGSFYVIMGAHITVLIEYYNFFQFIFCPSIMGMPISALYI